MLQMIVLLWFSVSCASAMSKEGLHVVAAPNRQQLLAHRNASVVEAEFLKRPEEHTARAIAPPFNKGFFDFFRRQPPPPPPLRWGPAVPVPYHGPALLRPRPFTRPTPHFTLPPANGMDREMDRVGMDMDAPNRLENGFLPSKKMTLSAAVNSTKIELPPPKALCDFYTDTICIDSHPYPYADMQRAFPMELPALRRLLADVDQQNAEMLTDGVSIQEEALYTFEHYYGNGENNSHSYKDYGADGGFVCPSDIRYIRPKRARNARGQWKTIVNLADHSFTQTIRTEKCLKPFSRCSYVFSYLSSECIQLYNYQRLASWDEKRGFHMDIYKIPVSCSCHLRSSSNLQAITPSDTQVVAAAAGTNQTAVKQRNEAERKVQRKSHLQQLLVRPTLVKPSRVLPDDRHPPPNFRLSSHKLQSNWRANEGGKAPAHSNRFQPHIGHRQAGDRSSSDRVNFEVNPISDYMHMWGGR